MSILKTKSFWLIPLSLILVIGALLRMPEIISGNYLFGFDQGQSYLDVKRVVVDHKLTLIGTPTPVVGLFQQPLFYYLLAIFFIVFNGNPYGGMVFMFIVSMGALLVSFFIARDLFDIRTSLVIIFLLAVSEAAAAAGRMLWPPYPIYLITPFYILFFSKAILGEKKFFPLMVFSIGLIASFEIASGSILFLPSLLTIFLLRKDAITKRTIILSVFGLILLFLPLILFDFRHANLISRGMLTFITGKQAVGDNPMPLIELIISHFTSMLANLKSSLSIFNLFWPFSLIIPLCGIFFMFVQKNLKSQEKKIILGLILLPIFTYLELFFFHSFVWSWYLLPFTVIYIFIFGFTFSKLTKPLKLQKKFWQVNLSKNLTQKIFAGIIFIFLVLIFLRGIEKIKISYSQDLFDYGGTAKIKGKIDALDYIYNSAKGEKFGLLVFSPPVYTYPYDYLIWWYGEKRYHYRPHQQKKGLFFLLIEPDGSKPWSYKGWLETVIKTGKIIETRELPSGFIIQKRLSEDKNVF